jgi:hypothetical protein
MLRSTSCNTEAFSRTAYVVGPSGIHGRGLLAARELGAGERIVEYRGRIQNSECRMQNAEIKARNAPRSYGQNRIYVFEVREGVYLDGGVRGNAARWVNHSCAPNCEAVEEGGRVWIFAQRAIAAGEELTFDYGFRLAVFLGHPCRCGAAGCAGYIVNARERRRVGRLLGRKGRSLTRDGRPATAGWTREAGA